MVDCDRCHHDTTVAQLKMHDEHMMGFISEMRDDIKAIKAALVDHQSIKQDHLYHREAMERAFERLEALEKSDREKSDIINQLIGMRKLAWTLWTVMASGLGVVIFKLFIFSGGVH